ncbi:FkbM family methyltransferase [Candidatus Aciduliprofundum boonei]|uniref:Methyltransferase FkbM family n=1 Tax=Aciduliprofundum boonei (strain DSM 19572 / T469) TaxID=439481 RepID=B5IDL0_ACIB4|nr:FkbM family methyltransferase [Candidatus Aciduliprofundum boonei]ADD08084.1 methyltransferase FkbM family [Aciduliprofundum boonei T469]EDY35624.1 methyltransferase, FkbM family protein [Aciduliprofundum boonei T469]
MKGIYTQIPIVESVKFSLKYLKNPWAIIPIFLDRPTRVDIKWSNDGGIVLKGKSDFWRLRDITRSGWEILNTKNGIIYLKNKEIVIAAHIHQISVVNEPLEKYYRIFDFSHKTVLDIGGYIGYSAILFSRWGAKKVIIYEAQRENIPMIKKNMRLNKVNGEVHNLAIADKDGYIELSYDELGTTSFGLGGNKKYKIRAISISRVLSSNIDIAKFDCEGCEYSLLSVPCEILRNVPRYVIEYHRGFESLKNKFEECGFKVQKLWKIKEQIGGFKAEVMG